MRIRSVRITNLRSIVDAGLDLGPITLLVGKNNSGKSTILRAINAIQEGGQLSPKDVRLGESSASVTLNLTEVVSESHWDTKLPPVPTAELKFAVAPNAGQSAMSLSAQGFGDHTIPPISTQAAKSFIVPFLSMRKATAYSEAINESQGMSITPNFSNLVARVDMLMDRHHPEHETFVELTEEVVRLDLSAIVSSGGKRVGMWVNAMERIYLEDMGDGIAQLLGFITNLCLAHGHVFLIEELENDIHPEALKLLLGVIEKRRGDNQFVLSTHNNIVMRHLGSLDDTKIYEMTSSNTAEDGRRLPRSASEPVGNTPNERTVLLKHLGYELSDLDLWDGWLLLEESSAERIIRDHLIRWFVPGLSRVRTMAAIGADDVIRSFDAIYKLVLYTHLEERYRGRVAVMLDGDNKGNGIVQQLKQKFPGWPQEAFTVFTKEAFELYYPARFAKDAAAALAVKDKKARRAAKKKLLLAVVEWIEQNEELAKQEFSESAAEVIDMLRKFEQSLGPASEVLSSEPRGL